MGWTSIYQLFWGSLGTRVLTHPQMIFWSHPSSFVFWGNGVIISVEPLRWDRFWGALIFSGRMESWSLCHSHVYLGSALQPPENWTTPCFFSWKQLGFPVFPSAPHFGRPRCRRSLAGASLWQCPLPKVPRRTSCSPLRGTGPGNGLCNGMVCCARVWYVYGYCIILYETVWCCMLLCIYIYI